MTTKHVKKYPMVYRANTIVEFVTEYSNGSVKVGRRATIKENCVINHLEDIVSVILDDLGEKPGRTIGCCEHRIQKINSHNHPLTDMFSCKK